MIEGALHAGLGWAVAGILVAASFGTSLITAAFGIGGGGVLLAILASLLPPAVLRTVPTNSTTAVSVKTPMAKF